jgi:glutathione S-transferase
MQPILYSSVNCPHSTKAAFFLAEKGVEFRRIEVSLAARVQKTPAYLALNPKGTVPTFEDEHGVIGDSLALMRHVDAHFDGPQLFPSDPDALHDVLRWIARGDADFWDVSHHLYWQVIEPPQTGTDWAEVARLRAKGIGLLAELEASLARQPYVCGDFSAADIALLPWVYGFQRFNLPERGQFLHVERWRDQLSSRATFRDNHNRAGYPFTEFLASEGAR